MIPNSFRFGVSIFIAISKKERESAEKIEKENTKTDTFLEIQEFLLVKLSRVYI